MTISLKHLISYLKYVVKAVGQLLSHQFSTSYEGVFISMPLKLGPKLEEAGTLVILCKPDSDSNSEGHKSHLTKVNLRVFSSNSTFS